MTIYTIDTAAAIDRMVSSGMPSDQAKAVVDTIAESQAEIVTKPDLDKAVAELKYFVIKTVIGTGAGLFIALKASQYLGF